MNAHGIAAIYRFEVARWGRTLWQSLITPVITTALYFVVFGSARGSRMTSMEGVSDGAFIVPGLTLLAVFMQSIFNASFGIYFPKFTGTIYELLSAPISSFEAVLAYVGAAVTKSVILALVTLATATIFVQVRVDHPLAMILFLLDQPGNSGRSHQLEFQAVRCDARHFLEPAAGLSRNGDQTHLILPMISYPAILSWKFSRQDGNLEHGSSPRFLLVR